MTVRMTGITGLLDTDSLVSASMEPYKLKVNTQKQKLQTLEWQQEQYRTVMSDSKSFYDKYLDPLGTKSLSLSSNYNTTKFTSDDKSVVTASASNGAEVDNYDVNVTQLASAARTTLNDKTAYSKGLSVTIGGKTIGLTEAEMADKDESAIATALNAKLSGSGMTAKYSEFSKGIVLETDALGTSATFTTTLTNSSGVATTSADIKGTNLKATITNSAGTYTIDDTDANRTNAVTLDGVTFNFKDTGTTTLTGEADTTDLKANIISFVNDYNTLLSSINTKIYETRDKDYTPLTEDQKDAMSDTEIENWEKKAQTGLLRKDSYLQDLTKDMKDAMSTLMSSTGLSLEEIGIKPVDDYTDKNGMLTIDEDKLTSALETNLDDVKDLFINGISSGDTTNGGVITKLKDAIYSGTISSTAGLVEQAGKDTGVSSLTNEMTIQLTEMKKKIAEMEDALEDREDALYTKYGSLESALSQLQSQQDSLSSYFSSSN